MRGKTKRKLKVFNAVTVKTLKPEVTPYLVADSDNLFIRVHPSGKLTWFYRYEFGGKTHRISLGKYEKISIAEARNLRRLAEADLLKGIDPFVKQNTPKPTTEERQFETVARLWLKREANRWGKTHAYQIETKLKKDIFPAVGKTDISNLSKRDILAALQPLLGRGAKYSAIRMRGILSSIFQFAIAFDYTENDPAAAAKAALDAAPKEKNHAALLQLPQIHKLLTDVATSHAEPITRLAVYLTALTALRHNEILRAEWTDLHLDSENPFWLLPDEKMKMDRRHIVPLSRQAIDVIETARKFSGKHKFIFNSNSAWDKPMSEAAMRTLLKRLGYQKIHTIHGFRTSFSTIMNENFPNDRQVIDLMLAHVRGGGVSFAVSSSEAAYNRAEFIQRRRELSQIWADLVMEFVPKPADLVLGPRR